MIHTLSHKGWRYGGGRSEGIQILRYKMSSPYFISNLPFLPGCSIKCLPVYPGHGVYEWLCEGVSDDHIKLTIVDENLGTTLWWSSWSDTSPCSQHSWSPGSRAWWTAWCLPASASPPPPRCCRWGCPRGLPAWWRPSLSMQGSTWRGRKGYIIEIGIEYRSRLIF